MIPGLESKLVGPRYGSGMLDMLQRQKTSVLVLLLRHIDTKNQKMIYQKKSYNLKRLESAGLLIGSWIKIQSYKSKNKLFWLQNYSLYNNNKSVEYIWQTDKNLLGKTFPCSLFPIVGRLKRRCLHIYKDKIYSLSQLSFARDKELEL